MASHGLAQGCLGRRDPFLFASSAHGFCQTQSPSSSPPHAGGGVDPRHHRVPLPIRPARGQGWGCCSFGISVALAWALLLLITGPRGSTHILSPRLSIGRLGLPFDPLSSGQCWGLCPLGLGGTPNTTGAHRLFVNVAPTGTHPVVMIRGPAPILLWGLPGPEAGRPEGRGEPFPHKAAGARSTA